MNGPFRSGSAATGDGVLNGVSDCDNSKRLGSRDKGGMKAQKNHIQRDLGLAEFNDGVWSTLSDFLDLQSLGRLGSVSEALRARQSAVSRAVSVIENNAPGAFFIAARLRRVLATKNLHAGHVASLLSRPHWNVRAAVLEALRDVGKDASAPHLDAAVELLEDSDTQVRLAALRLLRLFAPRTSVFAARFAAVLNGPAVDTQAQRTFIQEAFVALSAFGSHALPYGEQLVKARGMLVRSAEVEAASVAFAELGISFVPCLTACLKSNAKPSIVQYSVRHDRCLDSICVRFPEGIFHGAAVHALAIFEDLDGPMLHSPVHRDVSFTWSAWSTTISELTDSTLTLAEGRRRHFGKGLCCREKYTISCGGYDVSCTSFDERDFPSRCEMIASMARLNTERLEFYWRLGWSNDHNHIATCCRVLETMVSESDIEEKRTMFEGCACGFCASVLQVFDQP
jgi:hypothetical protein